MYGPVFKFHKSHIRICVHISNPNWTISCPPWDSLVAWREAAACQLFRHWCPCLLPCLLSALHRCRLCLFSPETEGGRGASREHLKHTSQDYTGTRNEEKKKCTVPYVCTVCNVVYTKKTKKDIRWDVFTWCCGSGSGSKLDSFTQQLCDPDPLN